MFIQLIKYGFSLILPMRGFPESRAGQIKWRKKFNTAKNTSKKIKLHTYTNTRTHTHTYTYKKNNKKTEDKPRKGSLWTNYKIFRHSLWRSTRRFSSFFFVSQHWNRVALFAQGKLLIIYLHSPLPNARSFKRKIIACSST